jgi:hypothetical protein
MVRVFRKQAHECTPAAARIRLPLTTTNARSSSNVIAATAMSLLLLFKHKTLR